ncbi:MAG TPA: hypothetical protein VFR86_12205 [Burkholderiaceae bacterium]|nr:hypothetical protein [Burkholderiaceae bacterium]
MPDAKSLAAALASSPAAGLLQRVALSAQVAGVLRTAPALPPGFDPCSPGICELRDSVLWLAARSPAEAAKLRQALPGLQKLLLRNGFEVNEIKVRLQPDLTAYQTRGSSAATDAHGPSTSASTAAPLAFAEKLAAMLPPSGLRDAANALATRLRRNRGRTD